MSRGGSSTFFSGPRASSREVTQLAVVSQCLDILNSRQLQETATTFKGTLQSTNVVNMGDFQLTKLKNNAQY